METVHVALELDDSKVANLFCWNRKIRKTIFPITFSVRINVNTSLFYSIEQNP